MDKYFWVLLGLWPLWINAQTKPNELTLEAVPLTEVFATVEERFDIFISYNSKTIPNREDTVVLYPTNLDRTLASLEETYGLQFKKMDQTTYVAKALQRGIFCGYLIDALQNTPIAGATITLKDLETGTISSSTGYFSVEGDLDWDTLYVDFLGYETLFISKSEFVGGNCPAFYLQQQSVQLKEVIVQEYLVPGVLKQRDGSVRINPNNLDVLSGLGEPDVFQNTQLLPGISSPNETASGVFIRGGSPDQNLILWDGIKLYNADHFFGAFSAFNPYVVESIEVYRSGANANYGDRISGVLDIKTTSKIPEKTIGGAGFNLNTVDAYINTPIGSQTGIQLSFKRSLTDLYDSPNFQNFATRTFQNTSVIGEEEVDNPQVTQIDQKVSFYDANIKLNSRLSKRDKLYLAGLITSNKFDFDFIDPIFPAFARDDLDVRNIGASAAWHRQWNTKVSTSFSAYYSFYDFQYDGERGGALDDTITLIAKSNTIGELGGAAIIDWKPNSHWGLQGGYQFFTNDVSFELMEDEFMEDADNRNPLHNLFVIGNYTNGKLLIKGSLRGGAYPELSELRLEPRVYAEYQIGQHLRSRTSFEIRNQSISQIIEFATRDFQLTNEVWAVADGDVFPILRSGQFTTGLIWQKDGWNLDLEGYYKNIDGLTTLSSGFEFEENDFTSGESTTYGLDALLKKKWNNYSTFLAYTLSQTQFRFDDLNNGEPFDGSNDVTHSLTWSHSYKWKRLQLSAGWNFRTGIPFTDAQFGIVDGDPEILRQQVNGERLPNYHRLDVSALYEFKLSHADDAFKGRLGIALLNVYNRNNVLQREFGFTDVPDGQGGQQSALREITTTALQFTPNLIFRVVF